MNIEIQEKLEFLFDLVVFALLGLTSPIWFIPYGIYKLCEGKK